MFGLTDSLPVPGILHRLHDTSFVSHLSFPSLPNLTVPNKNHAAFAISSNSIV